MKLLSGYRSLLLITCSALGLDVSFAQAPALEIHTVNAQLTDNISAHVRLPSISCASDGAELANALRSRVATLTNTVQRASQAVGFYSAEPQINIEKTSDCWLLSIAVEAGDPVLIKSVAISIEADADLFASTLETLPLREGRQLSHGDYEAAKAELSATALELGFLDARFTLARLSIDNSSKVNLDYTLNDRLKLKAESGTQQNVDLVYSVEKQRDYYSPRASFSSFRPTADPSSNPGQ